jgi:hypothetical protein
LLGATEVDLQTEAARAIDASAPDGPPIAEIATELDETPKRPITPVPGASKLAPSHIPRFGLIAGLSLLVLIPLACVLVFLVSPGVRNLFPFGSTPLLPTAQTEELLNTTPGNTSGPARTSGPASATLPAAEAPATSLRPTPVFFDDFSTPANGWPLTTSDEGGYTYLDGAYSIAVQQNGALYWAAPDGNYTDLSMQVEAGQISGDQGYYGLLCRIQDSENFYYFIIRPDGYFTIGKYQTSSFSALTPGGWTFHPAIKDGDAKNQLQAECIGDELRLSANGQFLGEVRDRDFESGRSGLIAAALDDQGFQAVFDNFTIYTPLP